MNANYTWKLTRRFDASGEWVIRCYCNGVRDEAGDSVHDNADDANATLAQLVRASGAITPGIVAKIA